MSSQLLEYAIPAPAAHSQKKRDPRIGRKIQKIHKIRKNASENQINTGET